MDRLTLAGVLVISLAILAWAAPQHPSVRGDQLQQVLVSNGTFNTLPENRVKGQTTGKVSAYKNNTRENAPGEGELFGYPESPSNIESKQNARNRTPVYIPNRCQKNEILYPGDQEYDWVCDCKPTFIYHPPTKQCYQLFTQGYCEGRTMLVLRKDAKQPECIPNSCHQAGVEMVMFQGDCVKLNDYHWKCRHHELKLVVSVREDTNDLGCVNISDVVGKFTHPNNGSMINGVPQPGN